MSGQRPLRPSAAPDMVMDRKLPQPIAALVLGLGLVVPSTGCGSTWRAPSLVPPIVTLELQNLTQQEREVLVSYFEARAGTRWRVERIGPEDPDTGSLAFRIHLHEWSEQEELHSDLVTLRAEPYDHLILQNHDAHSSLAYTSSQAKIHATARVTIAVVPASAKLYFDTELPHLDVGTAITTENGRYQLDLPFSFIKATEFIHFHSVFKGQCRYYRYNLSSERQELLPDGMMTGGR